MKRTHSVCLGLLLAGFASGGAAAQSFEADVAPLVETSCMTCHGARTATPLDIARLGHDLTDCATFRAWERIYERVENGEMPPRGVRRPDAAVVETALGSLKRALVDANLAARNGPRTPLRRLTRLEYAYTIQDLLGVDEAVGLDLSQGLPAEADSGGFDTVAANQSMSPLHVRAYLEAADRALDAAIRTDPRPERTEHRIEYVNSGYLPIIENAKALGLGIVKKLDDAFVAFFDFGSTYTFHSATEGFLTALPGRYRVRLSDPPVLAGHVDRMLDDAKADRFVRDLAGQAFRLYELRATTPDAGLYPEYDDRLGQAMAQETELFLRELVDENRGVDHLIAADFTFANRRLAEHYGLSGVAGQQMRRVALPADSPRGGLMTHASVLKVTANGTTTSPVPRGNFVLANLLGKPPAPPPPGIEGLEPDTRGTTTIREQLTAHRSNPVCASCHRSIDPPGFALESFDPIGGFRTNYRATGGQATFGGFTVPLPYTEGPPVDPSGVTPGGDAFAGIERYKELMLRNDLEQVARNLASQLLVFTTGAEIEFADRDALETIVARLGDDGYPIRSMIHEVVQSDLFRSR